MEIIAKPDFSFKGDRCYLHGTDIIPYLVNLLGWRNNIVVDIHKKITHQIIVYSVMQDDIEVLKRKNDLSLLFVNTELNEFVAIIEDCQRKITNRVVYDEHSLVAGFSLGDSAIERCVDAEFDFLIDRIVLLNKKLLTQMYHNNKWLFIRSEMNHYPSRACCIRISVCRVISKYYVSEVYLDEIKFGTITFYNDSDR